MFHSYQSAFLKNKQNVCFRIVNSIKKTYSNCDIMLIIPYKYVLVGSSLYKQKAHSTWAGTPWVSRMLLRRKISTAEVVINKATAKNIFKYFDFKRVSLFSGSTTQIQSPLSVVFKLLLYRYPQTLIHKFTLFLITFQQMKTCSMTRHIYSTPFSFPHPAAPFHRNPI